MGRKKKLIWFGGWEAHSPKHNPVASPRPLYQRLKPRMLAPVSFRSLTYYGWGFNWHTRWGVVVVAWRPKPFRIYVSPNGTPTKATRWFVGEPGP